MARTYSVIREPEWFAQFATLTAADFVAGMTEIWEGGVHYDRWHNARSTLQHIGAVWLYSSMCNGEPGYTYRLPSGDKVIVNTQGAACMESRNRRGRPALHEARADAEVRDIPQ